MRAAILFAGVVGVAAGVGRPADDPPAAGGGFPTFKAQEIDARLAIGYAVLAADLDADGKSDIVVVDQKQVVWYQNPTWKKRVILDGKTRPDNVCAAALDIDGGGDLELVVGAGWNPSDTTTPGTLQWLKRGKSLDDEWTLHPIPCDEPTVHRVRVADLEGDGKPEVIMAPLHGRGCTAKGNYTDGRPVRIVAYTVPAAPTTPENWKPAVLSDELHVVHNVWPYTPAGWARPMSILAASYEGYAAVVLGTDGRPHQTKVVHPGNQGNPKGSRGASEIKNGYFARPDPLDRAAGAFVATVEPWHGNEVAVYVGPGGGREPRRAVLDDRLRWGHAVWCADLDGDGADELVVGVRDDPKAGDAFTDRRGVRVYKCTDGKGGKWDRLLVDPGGVAVEDLAVADLNGDGKPDIVACGRQTRNVRIYWNQGK
jgi:hypothetical protein